jgi:hypothetical protein
MVRMDPTKPANINIKELDELKFNMMDIQE